MNCQVKGLLLNFNSIIRALNVLLAQQVDFTKKQVTKQLQPGKSSPSQNIAFEASLAQ